MANLLTPEDQKRAMLTALMTAGLGAMAASGRGRGALSNIGTGGLAGMSTYQQSLGSRKEELQEAQKRGAYGRAAETLAPQYPVAAELMKVGEPGAAASLIKARQPRAGGKFTKADRILQLAGKIAKKKASEQEIEEYNLLINADPLQQLRRQILQGINLQPDPAGLR